MRSNVLRMIVGAAAVALIVVLFVRLENGSSEEDSTSSPMATRSANQGSGEPPEPSAKRAPIAAIVVRGGEPVDGVAELSYKQGERARFKVSSDVADEVHLHGYDISKDLHAGRSVTFDFPAEIEGIFELELEESAVQIGELTVNP